LVSTSMNARPSLSVIDEIGLSITGRRLSDLGLDEPVISTALDPISSIRIHAGGGPAPDDVTRVTEVFLMKLQDDAVLLDKCSERVEKAAQMLEQEVEKYR